MAGPFRLAFLASAALGSCSASKGSSQQACTDPAHGQAIDSQGVTDEQSSLLQARASNAHAHQDISEMNSPPSVTSTVLTRTKALVERVHKLASNSSGDVTGALQQVREEVRDTLELEEAQIEADRDIVELQFADIQACITDYPVTSQASNIAMSCDHCNSCELDRTTSEQTREEACNAWNAFAQMIWNQMVGACQHSANFGAEPRTGEGCHAGLGSEQGSEEVYRISTAMHFWEENAVELQAKRSACDAASAAGTCVSCGDERQGVQDQICDFHEHCGSLQACHAREVELYNAQIARIHVAETEGLNTLQQESYMMHRHILCVLGLIEEVYPSGSTVSEERMDTCSYANLRLLEEVDEKLSQLDIPRRVPPALPACSAPSCEGACSASVSQCPAAPAAAGGHATSGGFTLSSSGSKVADRLAWNMPTVNPPHTQDLASVEEDSPQNIVVHNAGLYNVALQILPDEGEEVYPIIEVNGDPVMFGYGGSQHRYAAANMNVLLNLESNSVISVGFQSGHDSVYMRSDYGGVYHNLIIMPVQQNTAFTIASTGFKAARGQGGLLAWNMPTELAPAVDSTVASVCHREMMDMGDVDCEADSDIVVHDAGLYNVALQILPRYGRTLSGMCLSVNGNCVMYGYGGYPGQYAAANMNVLLHLESNSRISFIFQAEERWNSVELMPESAGGRYHNLFVKPVQQSNVFTMASHGSKAPCSPSSLPDGSCIVWDMPMPTVAEASVDSAVASVVDGSPQDIMVHNAGLYNIALQLMVQGGELYPIITVNGSPVMNGYGGSPEYGTANMNVLLQLESNSRISVTFQDGHDSVSVQTLVASAFHNLIISLVQ